MVNNKKIAGLFLAASILLFGCSKEQNTNHSKTIQGKWQLEYTVADSNHNNKPDDFEKSYVAAGSYVYFTFKNDGTFQDSLDYEGVSGVFTGTWTISGQQAFLSILGRSITYNILQLDASRLYVRDNDTPGNWQNFIRR